MVHISPKQEERLEDWQTVYRVAVVGLKLLKLRWVLKINVILQRRTSGELSPGAANLK